MSSFDRILSLLGDEVRLLFGDPDVNEIMVNHGGDEVFVERNGVLVKTDVVLPGKRLDAVVVNIARMCQDDITPERPILDAMLADGSRIAAMLSPCSVTGTTLVIRRFGRRYSLHDLVGNGTLTEHAARVLIDLVDCRKTILIAGATSTGKTTLLNALAHRIPTDQRIIVIEDTPEIFMPEGRHVLRFKARPFMPPTDSGPALPEVSIAVLVRAALRYRPDRLIVGEVRGKEAFDLLNALNTGHTGSLTTIHATSAEHALEHLATHVTAHYPTFVRHHILLTIAQSIHAVVYLSRDNGPRRVDDIRIVTGFDHHTNRINTDKATPVL